MTLNYKFAKPYGNGGLEFAPLPLVIDGANVWTNEEAKYNTLGYYEVVRNKPPVKEGFYYTSCFELENGKMVQKWEEHEEPAQEETDVYGLLDIVTEGL